MTAYGLPSTAHAQKNFKKGRFYPPPDETRGGILLKMEGFYKESVQRVLKESLGCERQIVLGPGHHGKKDVPGTAS